MICEESGTYRPNLEGETKMLEKLPSTAGGDGRHRDDEEQTQLYDWWIVMAVVVSISVTTAVMVVTSCIKKTARCNPI